MYNEESRLSNTLKALCVGIYDEKFNEPCTALALVVFLLSTL
jgi:hypothetical protein